jgi:glutathione S-transferase
MSDNSKILGLSGVALISVLGGVYAYNKVAAKKSFKSKPKLTYLNGRGLAETARLLLAEAGFKRNIDYDDIRLEKLDDNLKAKLPFGQVPIFEVDGVQVVQSNAINRFIARHYNLYGSSIAEGAAIDSILDGISDVRSNFARLVAFQPEEKKAEGKVKFSTEILPKWFAYFEAFLSKNKGGPWLVGNNISLADLALFDRLYSWGTDWPDVIKQYPLLSGLYTRVASRPAIAQHLKERPVTPF